MLKSSIELHEKLKYTWWSLLVCLLGLFIIYTFMCISFLLLKRSIKQNLKNTAEDVEKHENDKNLFIFKNIYINQQYIMA